MNFKQWSHTAEIKFVREKFLRTSLKKKTRKKSSRPIYESATFIDSWKYWKFRFQKNSRETQPPALNPHLVFTERTQSRQHVRSLPIEFYEDVALKL